MRYIQKQRGRRRDVTAGTPHIACVFVKMWAVQNRTISRLYTRTRHFSGLMLSTSATLRQSQRYPGRLSTQVPHTYSVTQPLPSHVYLSRCGQSKTAKFLVYTHGLDISVVLCSQLPPGSGNPRHIPESSPHRYLTRILSHNHCHRMCICQDVGSQKPLNFSFIHTDSTFQWVCSQLPPNSGNHRDTPDSQVHTGTSHICCHTSTAFTCVCVEQ